MSSVENEHSFNTSTISVPSPTTKSPSNQNYSESGLHDISLSSSVPICRICHCSSEEEQLIQPCRCCGSVCHAHQSCLRTWIVGSAISSCELCNYKFRTKRKRIKDIRKLHFPRPSIKGWLHLSLFLAFFSIMLTSLTWIMWSQISTSTEAQAERDSKEINYAYALNGGFIVMALIGLYLDSFTQCRSYYRRWVLLNQHLVILPYDVEQDTKDKQLASLSQANRSKTTEFRQVRLSVSSRQNSAYINDIPSGDIILPNPIHLRSVHLNYEQGDSEVNEHWSFVTSSYELPNQSQSQSENQEQFSLHESQSSPPDLQHCVRIKESYV